MSNNPKLFLSRTGYREVSAGDASKLDPGATINGVLFDGSTNITVTAAADTLTGTTLAPNVLYSSLTSVGTLTTLDVSGAVTGLTFNGVALTTGGSATDFLNAQGNYVAISTGTVSNFSFTNANGISGVVTNPTTTPDLTLSLGAITPTSVNSVVLSGSSAPILAVTGTSSISGSNTGDQTITLTGDVTGSGTGSFVTTIKTDVALAGSPTTTTQSLGDNSTKIATTAFVATAVAGGASNSNYTNNFLLMGA